MNTQHTPGPWSWGDDGMWLWGEHDFILFYTVDDDGLHGERADKDLIAAAPDLLEALEELHNKAVAGTDDERHAALDKAWRAIWKAKGGAA